MTIIDPSPAPTSQYYNGPERRQARSPRRKNHERRHRLRTEAPMPDCRTGLTRRWEDEQGFHEIANL